LTYDQAISKLYKLGHELSGASHKFDLAFVRVLLRELGNPEKKFKSVLIAGTNGKGSTAATLASILSSAGHRTGLYTSPHLVRINERIRINAQEIANDDFARVYDRVEAAAQKLVAAGEVPWHPSFFEMLTAMAFRHFADAGIDIAVLEVGMGGRLDATNVVDPLVSVITDISLDHQKFLGNTVSEIAREKAGIIRPNGVVVTLPQHPEANAVIGNTALERGARIVAATQYVPPVSPAAARDGSPYLPGVGGCASGYSLEVMGELITIASPLPGRHQLRNVALAIATAEELNRAGVHIAPRDIEHGVRETRWSGRFQVIPATGSRPELVLDGAHNPAGAWALRAALSEIYSDREITMVFGMMRDKDMREVTEILFPMARRVIVTHASNPRSATAEEIRNASARITTDIKEESTVATALESACELARGKGVKSLVVIAGSIYIVGEALAAIESARASA
jgi:dihydrofolate synthase/folylpolyglutamate synthase